MHGTSKPIHQLEWRNILQRDMHGTSKPIHQLEWRNILQYLVVMVQYYTKSLLYFTCCQKTFHVNSCGSSCVCKLRWTSDWMIFLIVMSDIHQFGWKNVCYFHLFYLGVFHFLRGKGFEDFSENLKMYRAPPKKKKKILRNFSYPPKKFIENFSYPRKIFPKFSPRTFIEEKKNMKEIRR